MMYKTDMSLLPNEIIEAIDQLHKVLVEHTDYLHVQLTLDDMRADDFHPMMHVVVSDDGDIESPSMDKGL